MAKVKQRSTAALQADLDAANAEAKGYLNELVLLRKSEAEAKANAERDRDTATLQRFIDLMRGCELPPTCLAVAAIAVSGKISMTHFAISDLRNLAGAIERHILQRGSGGTP